MIYVIIISAYTELKEIVSNYWSMYKTDLLFGMSQSLTLNIALTDYGILTGNIKTGIELLLLASTALATSAYGWFRVIRTRQKTKKEQELTELTLRIKTIELKRQEENLKIEEEKNFAILHTIKEEEKQRKITSAVFDKINLLQNVENIDDVEEILKKITEETNQEHEEFIKKEVIKDVLDSHYKKKKGG